MLDIFNNVIVPSFATLGAIMFFGLIITEKITGKKAVIKLK